MSVSIHKVLAALDLGPAAPRVCAYAAEFAQRFGAQVTALHVVEEIEGLKGLNLPRISYDDLIPELESRAQARLKEFVSTHLRGMAELRVEVTHGTPHRRILEFARLLPADLIVMATHGRSGLDRAIFGSTAERVIRGSSAPVVVVPAAE